MARIAIVALCACVPALLTGPAVAATVITLKPAIVHPKQATQVSGSGFGASEAVDVYFDTTGELLAVTDGTGKFAATTLNVPKDALPGRHWITAIGRKSGDAVQKPVTVRTDWPQYGFEQHDRGRNPYENVIGTGNAGTLDLAWTFHTGGASSFSSPAYYAGLIYIGSGDGKLYALTSAGTVKWSAPTGGVVSSSPAVAHGVVYVGSDDRKVYAYNYLTGAPVWTSAATGGEVFTSSPVIVGSTLYIGSNDGSVHALNTGTGGARWSTPAGTVFSTPAVVNGVVYIGSTSNTGLYALDAGTGAVLWNASVSGAVQSSPAVANGVAYFVAYDGTVHAVRAKDGSTVWSYTPGPGGTIGSPAVVNNTVFIGGGDQKLYALDAGSGALKWTVTLSSYPGINGVSVANGVGYVGDAGGRLTAFDLTTGAVLWTAHPGGELESRPAIADGHVYMESFATGDVYAFALDGGFNAAYRSNRLPPSYAALHPDFRLKPAH